MGLVWPRPAARAAGEPLVALGSPPLAHHGPRESSNEERDADRDPQGGMPPRLAPSTALVPGALVVLALLLGLGLVAYVLYSLINAQRG